MIKKGVNNSLSRIKAIASFLPVNDNFWRLDTLRCSLAGPQLIKFYARYLSLLARGETRGNDRKASRQLPTGF